LVGVCLHWPRRGVQGDVPRRSTLWRCLDWPGVDTPCARPSLSGFARVVHTTGALPASGTSTAGCSSRLAAVLSAPSAGAIAMRAWVGIVAFRLAAGGHAHDGGPREEWRGLTPDRVRLVRLPGLATQREGVHVSVGRHGLRARVVAQGRAPRQWGVPQGPRQAGPRSGQATGNGVSLGGRPTSSTWGPALCQCSRASRPAGRRGSTTSWGRGRLGSSTMRTQGQFIPGDD